MVLVRPTRLTCGWVVVVLGRHVAPEELGQGRETSASDMFVFGCMILQAYTGTLLERERGGGSGRVLPKDRK